MDRLLVEMLEEALADLPAAERATVEAQMAMVAIGGTGRGELAPFSDADVLFLRTSGCPSGLEVRLERFVRDCWDAGIKLGSKTHSPSDALAAALGDPQFATALVEARRLWGSESLLESFRERFRRKVVRRRTPRFIQDCLTSRDAERGQFGVSDRQLEPDVKRSAGGLRDVHLVRWIGYAAYGTPDIDLLRREGALSRADAQALIEAKEFLTRVRGDLHFAAGKAQEVLTREEQLRLAELYGYEAAPGQRPVERFMQAYFRHATAIADISRRFADRHRHRPSWQRIQRVLLAHRSNQIYRVGGGEIDCAPRHVEQACRSLENVLCLYELAGLYSARVTPELAEQVRLRAPDLAGEVTPRGAQAFLTILRSTGSVGAQLRDMFATGVLERVIPELTHARCLLQFNQYHSFTVDEHSLRAVEAAESFAADPGLLGTAYRHIRQKELLHLALLLHDLGKGHVEDHSEVGREIAAAAAERLGLSSQQRETLVFLVHKHLLMSHTALRRDLSDPNLLAAFSRDVGSPEWLRMLYVLTCADITAVGPTAWTSWKADLIAELFDRSLQLLSGEPSRFREGERVRAVVQQVRRLLSQDSLEGTSSSARAVVRVVATPPHDGEDDELERRLRRLPPHYLIATPPEQIADDLGMSDRVLSGEVRVDVRGAADGRPQSAEYRVVTRDEIGSGLFSRITGALTAKGLAILSAGICTTADGVVIDRFRVVDSDHAGPVPEYRLREVENAVADVLAGCESVESLFQRHRRFLPRPETLQLFREPTRVVIDNHSSDRFTIIDVFADDRRGLLYTIACVLFEMDVSVSLAKIATHVDQALDVFYVTDRRGGKLQDEQRLEHIRRTLIERIDEFSRRGLAPRSESVA